MFVFVNGERPQESGDKPQEKTAKRSEAKRKALMRLVYNELHAEILKTRPPAGAGPPAPWPFGTQTDFEKK